MGANSLRLGSYQKHNLAGADTQNDWFRYVLLGAVQNGRVFSTAPPLKLSITHSSWNYMVLWRTGPRLVGIRFGKDAFIYYASVASLAGWLDGASPLARHALIKSPLDGWFFIRPVFMSGISKPTPPRPACKLDDGNVDDDDDRQ